MQIFDIVGGKVVINPHCLLIPQLKAVVETYKDCKINALSYLYYLTDPDSPYSNLPEDRLEDTLKRDFPGDYESTDVVILNAAKKLKEVFLELPEVGLYQGAKKATDNLAIYFMTETDGISDPTEANKIADTIKKVDAIFESLGSARTRKNAARVEVKTRGQGRVAYDQL